MSHRKTKCTKCFYCGEDFPGGGDREYTCWHPKHMKDGLTEHEIKVGCQDWRDANPNPFEGIELKL